ncbi:MAG: ester cyclase [Ferruginibacter sp.]
MHTTTEQNKTIVKRFNKEFIEQGNFSSFMDLVSDDVINHAAPPGSSKGANGMIHFIENILRAAFANIKVEILDQVAEADKVTTRKVIHGTHTGELMGVHPTGKCVAINVIDIIRIKDGKYAEHWGNSNFSEVVGELSSR